MTLPLEGIRILSVEQFGAGPFGTLSLADMGAEVIKIEDPVSGGDVARYVPPFEIEADSLYFQSFNRGKRSVAIDLRSELRTALIPLGDIRRVYDLMREAEILAKAADDQRRLGHISGRLCHTYWQMGNYELALAVGERSLAISMTLGNVVLQFDTNLHLAYPYYTLGQYHRAIACLRTNLVSLEGELPPQRLSPVGDNAIHCRALLSHCLAKLGAFAEGITLGEEGLRIARVVDLPYGLTSAYSGVGGLYLYKGELDQAIAKGDSRAVHDELGDVLFALTSLARRLGQDPEHALRDTLDRFTRRVQAVESLARAQGRSFTDRLYRWHRPHRYRCRIP
jgi:tetratricopeptide (TPR) repeat protein